MAHLNKLFNLTCFGILFSLLLSCNKETLKHDISAVSLKSLEVNDENLHYLDKGSGVPVVFVHGGVGDYRTWESQIDAFANHYRVISLSRRFAYPNNQIIHEHNDFSVQTHADDLSVFLQKLGSGPVHLVGHSYGGFTALLTTLQNPELVKSLTLGEPPVMSFLAYVEDGQQLGMNFVKNIQIPSVQAFKEGNDELAVQTFIGGVLNDKNYFINAPDSQKQLMMDNAFGLKGVLMTENPFANLTCQDVKGLTVPTLLINGERSPRILTAISDELNKCLPNSKIKTLPNASHGLEYENPKEFNSMVLEFIQTQ